VARGIAILACTFLAVLAGGCSGENGTVSREDWAEDANAICEEMLDDLDDVEFDDSSPEQFQSSMREYRAAALEHLRRLRELPRPPRDEARIGEMLNLYESALDAGVELADASPVGAGKSTAAEVERYEEAEKTVDRYGNRADAIAGELGVTCLTE
jgi:hypothetical protein